MQFLPFHELVANKLAELGQKYPDYFPKYSKAQEKQLLELLDRYLSNRERTPTQRWSMHDWPPQEKTDKANGMKELKWPKNPKYPMPKTALDEMAIILAIVEKVTGFHVESRWGFFFLILPQQDGQSVLYNPKVDRRLPAKGKNFDEQRAKAVRTIDFLQD